MAKEAQQGIKKQLIKKTRVYTKKAKCKGTADCDERVENGDRLPIRNPHFLN